MTIDDQRYARARKAAEDLGLTITDERLGALARQAEKTGSNIAQTAKRLYTNIVEQQTSGAFVSAPQDILGAGTVTLGNQAIDNSPVMVSPHELSTHVHVASGTGGGKTSFLSAALRSLRAAEPRVRRIDFDQKTDWRRDAADNNTVIITPTTPIAMLTPPSGTDAVRHYAHVRKCLLVTTYSAGHVDNILTLGMEEAQRRNPHYGLGDAFDVIHDMLRLKGTYQFQDSVLKTDQRGNNIRRLRPGLLARDGWTIDDLSQHNLYIDIPSITSDIDLFFFVWLVESLYLRQREQQRRDPLSYVIVMDEATTLWQANDTNRINDTPYLSETHSRVREYGISFWTTSTSTLVLDRLFRSNTSIQVAMRMNNAAEITETANNMGLTKAQAMRLRSLPPGEAIIRLPRWPHAIHATFPPPSSKSVTSQEWAAAITRTEQQTPKALPAPVPATNAPNTQPAPPIALPPKESPALPAAPPPPAAPVAHVRLSVAEEALLRATERLVIPMATEAYTEAKLSLQVGDRAAKQNESLGFLTRNPILARPGRGGNATALQLTTAGYDRIGAKPPHGTRGGSSAQHDFLIHRLARAIPGAMVEKTLGGKNGKSIDLVLRRGPEHDHLLRTVEDLAQPLAPTTQPVGPGDLIAIEIETTEATALNNATKNLDAGIALHIAATLPKALDATMKALLTGLATQYHERVIVIDALRLLHSLREGDAT